MSELRYVGKPTPPVLGEVKVTGRGRFAPDYRVTGALHAAVLRSPVPHAELTRLETTAAAAAPGVAAVITREDLGLDRIVRHYGDVVAAVAAETAGAARAAIAAVDVEFGRLGTVVEPVQALEDAPPLFTDRSNLALELNLEIGDATASLAAADVILEATYRTGRPTHCNLSRRCCVATVGEDGVIEVMTSVDAPFFARRELAEALGVPVERVRIVLPGLVTSSFGGRTGIARGCEPIAARLAMQAAGRPVRLLYDPIDEFVAGTTRHAVIARLAAGATADGRLLGLDVDVVADHGPYDDFVGRIVLSACRDRPLDLYDLDHYSFRGRVALSNNLMAGEMRGIGATQVCAVLGIHMDELARRLGIDPVEFHLANLSPRARSASASDREGGGLQTCLERGAASFGWSPRTARSDSSGGPKRRGFGVGIGTHTTGLGTFHGPDRATAVIALDGDAVTVAVAAPDSGQGSTTVLAQIVAEELGVPIDAIQFRPIDTASAPPDNWGSVASRGTYVVGRAVRLAAARARQRIVETGARTLGLHPTQLRVVDGRVVGDEVSLSIADALDGGCVEVSAEGVTNATPPTYGACFAEVEVDADTGDVRVVRCLGVLDVGFAVNPAQCRGQIEGAIAMGVEFALGAEVVMRDGFPENTSLVDYRVARSSDLPAVDVILVEGAEESGPYGARGIGTPALTPVVPAIVNAVRDAVGFPLTTVPISPEHLTSVASVRLK
jgi:CO/xanthine dehydrogenase Mo-binding subunit